MEQNPERTTDFEGRKTWSTDSVLAYTQNFVEEYAHLIKGSSASVYYDVQYEVATLDSISFEVGGSESVTWCYSKFRDGENLGKEILFVRDGELSAWHVTYDAQQRLKTTQQVDASTLFTEIIDVLDGDSAKSFRESEATRYEKLEMAAVSKKELALAAIQARIVYLRSNSPHLYSAIDTAQTHLQSVLTKDFMPTKPHFTTPALITPLEIILQHQR